MRDFLARCQESDVSVSFREAVGGWACQLKKCDLYAGVFPRSVPQSDAEWRAFEFQCEMALKQLLKEASGK